MGGPKDDWKAEDGYGEVAAGASEAGLGAERKHVLGHRHGVARGWVHGHGRGERLTKQEFGGQGCLVVATGAVVDARGVVDGVGGDMIIVDMDNWKESMPRYPVGR
jgi:hypothetical protein